MTQRTPVSCWASETRHGHPWDSTLMASFAGTRFAGWPVDVAALTDGMGNEECGSDVMVR